MEPEMSLSEPSPTGGRRSSRSPLVWMIVGGCGLMVLLGVAVIAFFLLAGTFGPETDVYGGNEIPGRFIDTMRDLGALAEDERIDYFYSDGFFDIRDGFYYVSDRRVVTYREDRGAEAVTAVAFDEIDGVQLERDESFFVDSQVTLNLRDGSVVSFPVSSEHEGDVRFVETIRERMGGGDK